MQRSAAIRRVLWLVLWLNLTVALAKLAVGYRLDTLALIADGFHSLLDGSSNVIGLVGMYVAGRPPDRSHPYGHHKFEAFAALGIALLLGLTALEVLQASWARLGTDAQPVAGSAGFIVMGATMAVNAAVSAYEARQGRRLHSEVLLADSAHTRSDLLVSASVLAGLVAVWWGLYWVDGVVAAGIAVVILVVGYTILRRVMFTLTDSAVLDPAAVAAVAEAVPGVASTSNVRSRGDVPHLFIDLEVQLRPDLPLQEAHRIAHEVRDGCMRAFQASDVVVHMEPALPEAKR